MDRDSREIDLGSNNRCNFYLPIGPAGPGRAGRAELRREDLAPNVIARFHENIQKTESCWLWTGAKVNLGYGQVYTHRRLDGSRARHYAHRVSYALTHGYVPAHLEVMHSCDVPGCVNPDHLSLGTHAVNMADRERKGRGAKVKPKLRKISPEDVCLIRARLDIPSAEWARAFGVCVSHINRIRRGERRKAA